MMSHASRHDGHDAATPVKLLALLSLIFAGAMFGFFFAWVCSTMWGLDAADPNVAIAAMQAMNAGVRNMVFAPAFFGTPVVLIITALVAARIRARRTAIGFAVAGVFYVSGAMLPTMTANVPLNEALALVETPLDPSDAHEVWQNYSGTWQFWNVIRTIATGLVLTLVGVSAQFGSR